MQRAIAALIVVIALAALSAPVLAGGWAAVRLDEPPGDVLAGTPWRFGFMVLQHDKTPNSDVTPIVSAINKETGEQVTATAIHEGAVGHFVAELTLPESGEWTWEIRPEPFAETALETLNVVDELGAQALAFPASIYDGSCAKLGDVAFDIDTLEPQATYVKSTQSPVGVGDGIIDSSLSELVKGEHAISISESPKESMPIACGEVIGMPSGEALVVGLQPANDSGAAGIAVLQGKGDQTSVTLYLLAVESDAGMPGKAETIEMLDNWMFSPVKLEAAVGTTVTWVNNSDIVHMVIGEDQAFDASGLIEPGQSFSMSFDKPGAYHYRCSPHTGMEGVIVIS